MKRVTFYGLILFSIFVITICRPFSVSASSPIRIEGTIDHVVRRGESVNYTQGLRIVGDGAENYSINDIIVDDSQVNISRTGTYIVTYFLRQTDVFARGTVVVIDPIQPDDSLPIIEGAKDFDILLGSRPQDLLRETTAFDGGQDLTDKIIIDDSGIDYDTPGEYALYYYVSDETGNVAIKRINVRVIEQDDVKPLFIGLKDLTVNVNEPLDLLQGIRAFDNVSGDLTDKIHVEDSLLSINKLGTYPVIFRVVDEAENEATQTIMITVVDRSAPVIKIKRNLRFKIGSTPQYKDFFTITDNYDRFEDLTIEIDSSDVDIYSVGSYQITVTAKDRQNNTATESFLIYVYYSEDTFWNNPFLIGVIIAVISSFIVNGGYYFYFKRKL